MKYKTIDLCAGIGGIRRGFELTNSFENVLSAEIDQFAIKTYQHLFGEDPTNDLTTEEFKKKLENIEYDVLLAGFPCQTFSLMGKKNGFRDTTRGTIFFDIADIIVRTKPRAVFLENVENLLYHDKGNTIKTIVRTLEDELGYRIIGVTKNGQSDYSYSQSTLTRNSKKFGVPQNRSRVYLIAFNKKTYGNALNSLDKQMPSCGELIIYKDLNDIIEHNVDDRYYISQSYWDTLKRHKARNQCIGNGFSYRIVNLPDNPHPIANTIMATGGSGKERNLIFQPKAGVSGKIIPGKKTPLNSEGIRFMTPTEWGKLQGFIGYAFVNEDGKDTFSFPEDITDTQKYKQFGNSVTIPVIKKMADFMLECFDFLEQKQLDIVMDYSEKKNLFSAKEIEKVLDTDSKQAEKILQLLLANHYIIRIPGKRNKIFVQYKKFFELKPENNEWEILKFAYQKEVFSNSDIKSHFDLSQDYITVILHNMVKKGYLYRITRGKYTVI